MAGENAPSNIDTSFLRSQDHARRAIEGCRDEIKRQEILLKDATEVTDALHPASGKVKENNPMALDFFAKAQKVVNDATREINLNREKIAATEAVMSNLPETED